MLALSLMVASLCTGCASSSFAKLNAIPQSDIYKVIAEVKRQISVYTSYQSSKDGYARILQNSKSKVCGNGLIGFDIVSVKMELVSTSEGSASLGLSLSPIPVASSTTIGGKAGASLDTTDTQTFEIAETVSPSPYPQPFDQSQLRTAPLAVSMINLWGAALQSGDDRSDVCLHLKKSADGDDNTFKMAITVAKGANGEVDIGLTNVGLTAGGDFKATSGNTITVKFEPHDFTRPRPPRPKPCRAGDTRPECANQNIVAPTLK
ncbi:MAG: hypothetical protein E6Q76_13835 [Rhizobium sp.]|nr:MAG: hypothetical protein E6Q76_13835 [Rhizobium sp.]